MDSQDGAQTESDTGPLVEDVVDVPRAGYRLRAEPSMDLSP